MFTYLTVSSIRERFQQLKSIEQYVTDKTGVKMLEIINANFIADEPSIFGKVNQSYVDREIAWYHSKSLNVNAIPGGPPAIWQQVSTPYGLINSNYGWCIWSQSNGDQYNNVVKELTKNHDSRRAVMIYTRPSMWTDYNKDGMSDFMCTNAVQYVIRNDKLNAIVQMRSNDVVFGYKNDYFWQSHVLDMLCKELKVERGLIYWNAGSLHVYERHFELII